jgi:hypothetical protein
MGDGYIRQIVENYFFKLSTEHYTQMPGSPGTLCYLYNNMTKNYLGHFSTLFETGATVRR